MFENNYSPQNGGALYLKRVRNFSVQDSLFKGNYVNFDRKGLKSDKLFGYQISKGGSIYYEVNQNNINTQEFMNDKQILDEQ